MSKEIERKFLVKNSDWMQEKYISCTQIDQAYLHVSDTMNIRVRILNDHAVLTIKGQAEGITRNEFEYRIPWNDALELFKFRNAPALSKTRTVIEDEHGQRWEIDEFLLEDEQLVLAEIELTNENQEVILPDWIGEEVTHDPQYYNGHIAQRLSAGASKPFDLGSNPSMPSK